MVIENAERFGLSQLHQLRGRVGRGAEQSYCILMTDYKISKETKLRIDTMCRTNDGFEIAEVDLQLRGPGDISGTQQSGLMDLLVANLAQDGEILKAARASAEDILTSDPDLLQPVHQPIRVHLENLRKEETNWSRIS
jgi:ATP-dependent DNA helicase RecG